MEKIIKCTICGSTNFVRRDLKIEECLDVPSLPILGINAYVCQECGHIEIFDSKLDVNVKNKSNSSNK